MKRNMKTEYVASMDAIHFSPEQKAAMAQGIMARMEESTMNNKTMTGRKLVLIAAAAALLLMMLTGAAVFTRWSKSAQQQYSPSQKEKEYAESVGLSTLLDEEGSTSSVYTTDQGVTLTATQTIVDQHSAQLFFQIDGFDVPDGEEPYIQIGSFGIQDTHVIEPVIMFGEYRKDEPLEFMITFLFEKSMEHIGKPIKFHFISLGTTTKPSLIKGDWILEWTLYGTNSESVVTYDLNVPIDNTDYTLIHAGVSPLSIYTELTIANNDNSIDNNDPLHDLGRENALKSIEKSFIGVRTKDGSIHTNILVNTGFSSMYSDEGMRIDYPQTAENLIMDDKIIIRYCRLFNRIIDPAEIDAFVFCDFNSSGKDLANLTKDDYIIIPIQ